MTIIKHSDDKHAEILAMIRKASNSVKKREKDPVWRAIHIEENNITSLCDIRAARKVITTRRHDMSTLEEIRQRLEEQEVRTSPTTLTELVFKNGMELPSIETAVKPAMDNDILVCPNENCTEEPTHIHPGTITRDDGDIYIPFTCEYCRFTFRLDFTYKDGTISLKWNKSII